MRYRCWSAWECFWAGDGTFACSYESVDVGVDKGMGMELIVVICLLLTEGSSQSI